MGIFCTVFPLYNVLYNAFPKINLQASSIEYYG